MRGKWSGGEGERGTSVIGRTGILMDSGPTRGREPASTTLRYVCDLCWSHVHTNKLRGRGREGGREGWLGVFSLIRGWLPQCGDRDIHNLLIGTCSSL